MYLLVSQTSEMNNIRLTEVAPSLTTSAKNLQTFPCSSFDLVIERLWLCICNIKCLVFFVIEEITYAFVLFIAVQPSEFAQRRRFKLDGAPPSRARACPLRPYWMRLNVRLDVGGAKLETWQSVVVWVWGKKLTHHFKTAVFIWFLFLGLLSDLNVFTPHDWLQTAAVRWPHRVQRNGTNQSFYATFS